MHCNANKSGVADYTCHAKEPGVAEVPRQRQIDLVNDNVCHEAPFDMPHVTNGMAVQIGHTDYNGVAGSFLEIS
uniref:Uncharacterized protein n=1 Tax=Oryza glaberrima TaxID=4538 RepID=I1PTN3_ORYGL